MQRPLPRRTQIYCPGFPVMTVEAAATEKQVDPSRPGPTALFSASLQVC